MDNLALFGVPLFDSTSFSRLLLRFAIDLVFITILIRGIYYPINKKRDFLLTFFIFNVLIFFVSSLLSAVKLETGFAFGLFAVFSIIRYRTRQIPIKEMTFLFISIILATINSTVTILISYSEILFANVAILGVSYLMEKLWLQRYCTSFRGTTRTLSTATIRSPETRISPPDCWHRAPSSERNTTASWTSISTTTIGS